MGLPAPKIRDLAAWSAGTSPQKGLPLNEVWEIGVPEKNSLSWSIVLSYLYLASDSELEDILRKLTGSKEEVKEIQGKKKIKEKSIDVNVVKQQLKSFNPFKNRHDSFHKAKEISDVFRIFDLRLKRFANKRKKKTDDWNDDFKLNSASLFLECVIDVYFPDEINNQKVVTYPKMPHDFKTKIVLFQYESRYHGLRKDAINVFHFTMTIEQAHSRKLDALVHFLRKAKFNSEDIRKVKELMDNPKVHGKNFLPTILSREHCEILPKIYRSPYIAIKLSEAGFETNPIENFHENPSSLGYAAVFCKNEKCLRILYDYASNCGVLLHHSLRKADDTVLEALKEMNTVLENDRSKILSEKLQVDTESAQSALYVLEQYILFAKYQTTATSDLITLKKQSLDTKKQTEDTEKQFWKQVIESILENYLKYFSNSKSELHTIQDQLINFINFSEYYENVDSFAWISFFDNFYRLRLRIGLKQENLFLNIEWKIFIAMKSNVYFPMLQHDSKYDPVLDKIRCQENNVLRYIPLYHRNILRENIIAFLEKIKDDSSLISLGKSLKKKGQAAQSDALPQVTDELLIIRLKLHIEAVSKMSPSEEGIKAILVIERALQIIGESIKPPSSNGEVVSYLLRSRLPINLERELIRIRNDISHYYDSSVHGRLSIEKKIEYFNSIKEELIKINELFDVVYFTQLLRTEEAVMFDCLKEIGKELSEDMRQTYRYEYLNIIKKRQREYKSYHSNCLQLLYEMLCDLQHRNNITCDKNLEKQVTGQMKAILYLLGFINNHTNDEFFLNMLNGFKEFVKTCENKKLDCFKREVHDSTSNVLKTLTQKYTDKLMEKSLSAPKLEVFFTSLKQNLFLDDEKNQIKIAMHCAYDEAIEAHKNLEKICTEEMYELKEELGNYLKRAFIPVSKINEIKELINSGKMKQALKLLKKKCFSRESFERDIKTVLEEDSAVDGYFRILLIKVTYQHSKFYPSATLSQDILIKLDFFLMKKIQMLLTRLEAVKSILIDENEEIRETWAWGRSEVIKHHNKFFMRQRYLRDITVRASLDMAFLDCMSILYKDCFKELYEKSTDLFSGINLRNITAHRSDIPETIGGILDENDFPSAVIEKLLILIEDTEAVESMAELFRSTGCLEKDDFVSLVNSSSESYKKQIASIKKCPRWENYLFLLPFISI